LKEAVGLFDTAKNAEYFECEDGEPFQNKYFMQPSLHCAEHRKNINAVNALERREFYYWKINHLASRIYCK
jgi:hypothetical protein